VRGRRERERGHTGARSYVVDKQATRGTAVIGAGDGAERFRARGVPAYEEKPGFRDFGNRER
jgi:hypothetical protein